MTILDMHGRPIDRAAAREPQTARTGSLYTEFENHPSRGLTPRRLAAILEQAEQGDIVAQHELFCDMEEKDAHIYAEMLKRKSVLLTLPWTIAPPRNADKREENNAAWLTDYFADAANLEDVIMDLADAIGHGFAALEIEWQRDGHTWTAAALHHRPQNWFCLPQSDRNALHLRTGTPEGEPLTPGGWLVHIHRAKSGWLARSGLHRILAWPYLFKNYSVRDMAEFLEIYGLPLRLGKYPPGAAESEKAALMQAVVGIGHAAAGIIPQGMEIDFKEAAKGQSDPYMAMIDWAERSESKAIIGQTTSSEARSTGLGSAVANLHADVRDDIKKSDARQIAGALTRLGYLLLAFNGRIADLCRAPRFVFDTSESEDIAIYAAAIPQLVSAGVRIPEKWVHEKLQIPEPQKDEPVLASSAVIPADMAKPPADTGLAANSATAASQEPDAFEQLADIMAGEWEPVMAPLLEPIETLAANCTTLEEFRERLAGSVSQMDTARLQSSLARSAFAAALTGRAKEPDTGA